MSAAVGRREDQRSERGGRKKRKREARRKKDPLTLKDTGPNCLRLKISAQGLRQRPGWSQLLLRKKTGALTVRLS